MDWT
jgi:hypothetical protein